ncbi:MAG: DUF1848 domain-containing protein [Chloroflexota bacterium]
MIISASRRTDIPAFYAEWFIKRIQAGACEVPHPFNPRQVLRVSLAPEDVDVIVFWTRDPRPLFPHLAGLEARGYRYYFQYTLLNYPRPLEMRSPLKTRLQAFHELAERIGPERVIWRYDPLVFTEITPPDFHLETYQRLARALRGATRRSVISLLTPYDKIKKRMQALADQGAALLPYSPQDDWFGGLLGGLASAARANGMQITSCASELPLEQYGIQPGKCVDDEYIQEVFGLEVSHTKDPGQRKACGCVISKDIGVYDTCLFGCPYCYATSSFERARANHARHDPNRPALLHWEETG